MRKRTLLLLMLPFCLALGLSGCSDSDTQGSITTSDVSTPNNGAAALEGAWYRVAAVKADGTPYSAEELAENPGGIVFENGTFTEDWPEGTSRGSYAYADGVVNITYEVDGDTQTLTLSDDGSLSYLYEMEGSVWDGEISTFSRVSPIDGMWSVTSAIKADGTAFTADEVAEEGGALVFDRGAFTEIWSGENDGAGTFVYTPATGDLVLAYDDGKDVQTLVVDARGNTITWRYVNKDPDDEDHDYDGEIYTYAMKAAE
jgi:hypothetical protein